MKGVKTRKRKTKEEQTRLDQYIYLSLQLISRHPRSVRSGCVCVCV